MHFAMLYFLILFAFANGLYLLDLNRPEGVDSASTVITGSLWIDTIINQYMLGLGEFNMDPFAESPYGLLMWIMFLLATFIIMLLFLNLVIAIMGSTYGDISENWDRSSLITRTQMYADF
jgi:hypothetical protein